MEYRPLGRTGVQVSKLCLGTMMFGAWGNTDHDDSIRIIHRALDAGINFVDTADVYSAGESEEIVGKALKGRRDDVVLATKFFVPMGEDPNRRGGSRRWIVRRSRTRCGAWAPTGSTSTRSTAPTRRPTSTRRSARSPIWSGRARSATSARRRSPPADRRGAVGRARPPPAALPHRAAAVLAARPRHRARRPADRAAPRHGHPHLQPARGRLALGQLDRRQLADLARTAAPRRALRHVAAREPAQARSGRAARQGGRRRGHVADRAGDRLRRQPPGRDLGDHRAAHHGAARAANCPPPTSCSTPRPSTASTRSSQPGVNLNPADTSYGEHVLAPAGRRR